MMWRPSTGNQAEMYNTDHRSSGVPQAPAGWAG